MSDFEQLAAALEAAGHTDAGRLVRSLAARQQAPSPSVAEAVAGASRQPTRDGAGQPITPEIQAFSDQIDAARARSGWTTIPLDLPASDDKTGRF